MVSEWYGRNREYVNQYKRDQYQKHREQLLKDHREDRVRCPLCPHITKGYTRSYLVRHLRQRHPPALVDALDLSAYRRGGSLGPERRSRGYLELAVCMPCRS